MGLLAGGPQYKTGRDGLTRTYGRNGRNKQKEWGTTPSCEAAKFF